MLLGLSELTNDFPEKKKRWQLDPYLCYSARWLLAGRPRLRKTIFFHSRNRERKGSPREPKGRDKSFQENEKGKGKIFKGTKKAIYVHIDELLTIIPRARMGSESIAHEAEGRMGY